jgi:hypothetical protein
LADAKPAKWLAKPTKWLAKPTKWLASHSAGRGRVMPAKSTPPPKQAIWRRRKPKTSLSSSLNYPRIRAGYFEHRRRHPEDPFIVSHLPWLIMKYDCHINVELSTGVAHFQYLFKYFFKSLD